MIKDSDEGTPKEICESFVSVLLGAKCEIGSAPCSLGAAYCCNSNSSADWKLSEVDSDRGRQKRKHNGNINRVGWFYTYLFVLLCRCAGAAAKCGRAG